MHELILFNEEIKNLSPIQFQIFKTLKEHGSLQRGYTHSKEPTLLSLTHIPRSTLYDNLEKLEQNGFVERYEVNNYKRGAPKVYWKLKKGGED